MDAPLLGKETRHSLKNQYMCWKSTPRNKALTVLSQEHYQGLTAVSILGKHVALVCIKGQQLLQHGQTDPPLLHGTPYPPLLHRAKPLGWVGPSVLAHCAPAKVKSKLLHKYAGLTVVLYKSCFQGRLLAGDCKLTFREAPQPWLHNQ